MNYNPVPKSLQIRLAPHSKPMKVTAYVSKNGKSLIVPICPQCGRRHVHGLDGGFGHRAPHCVRLAENPGYILVPPKENTDAQHSR